MPSDKKYSLAQAARMFRVAPAKVKSWANDGKLPLRIDGRGRYFFLAEDLLEHLDELIERNDRIL